MPRDSGTNPPRVLVIGGGMIVHDQILPSLYHLQRLGRVADITVCATRTTRLRPLAESAVFAEAFPGQAFHPMPDLALPDDRSFPELYEQALAALPPRQFVVLAVPDQLHYRMLLDILAAEQHVLVVKPLVQTHQHAVDIERRARAAGLYVGVEYHKRFDRRSLEARLRYRQGRFGAFRCGEAKLIEPYRYRHSNFQNWFTKDNSDPFTYIGCHYVDLVYFITGLWPVEVAVKGIEGTFPNGNEAWMWASGQVTWENGAVLSVTTGLGYPDRGAGSNDQAMCLYGEGVGGGAVIHHDDQFRGVSHGYVDDDLGTHFRFVSPDYFRLVPWEGEGLRPVGYGYESIEAHLQAAVDVERAGAAAAADRSAAIETPASPGPEASNGVEALRARQAALARIDEHGILATPANSAINELVTEAARISIADNGRRVEIVRR